MHVKHEAKRMHMRRKSMQCTTMHCATKNRSTPRNPWNSVIPGTGNPRKDPEEPRLGVASAVGPLSQIRHRALGTKWSAPRLMQPREVQNCSLLRAQTPGFPGAAGRGWALPGFVAYASGTVFSPTRAPKRAKAASEGRPDDRKGPRADERSLSDAQDGPQTAPEASKTPQWASKRPPKRAPRGKNHCFSIGF